MSRWIGWLFGTWKHNGITATRWQAHIDAKFKQYERGWGDAYARWREARDRDDREAMVAAFEEQAIYLRAERLANRDMMLPSAQYGARWHVDYLAQARAEARDGGGTLAERLAAAESVLYD